MPSEPAKQGMAAAARGDWEVAEIAFGEALEADPHDADANLGMARMALDAGYPEDVFGFTAKVMRANPRALELHYCALRALGRLDEAFSWAIERLDGPLPLGFRFRMGNDLLADARYAEALVVFRKWVKHEPGNFLMQGGLAAACYGLGRMEECRKAVRHQLRLLPDDPQVHAHWVALHAGVSSVSAEDFLTLAREWGRKFGKPVYAANPDVSSLPHKPENRLRVGFLCSTFRHHANCQFLLPLLESLDRSVFSIHAYHAGSHEDSVTARCRAAVDLFRNVHDMCDATAAAAIRADSIDILIDINAQFDQARMRILCHHPAPVIAHYLGGVGTTGLSCVHWRLADDLTEPPEISDQASGTERIHRLEGGIHAFRPLCPTAGANESPAITNGYVTFGCLNALYKIEDSVLELWGRCLKAVTGSRLRLVKQSFRHASNREDFQIRAMRLGIDPKQLELVTAGEKAFDDLSVYHDIDIALDTFAYNGITTTCESLWMGVPVVTMRGNRFVAREAASILERIGHAEWTATRAEEFVGIACGLASDPFALASIRSRLRGEFIASPLGDADRLAKQFGNFLIQATAGLEKTSTTLDL